jgi:hypothetical protein
LGELGADFRIIHGRENAGIELGDDLGQRPCWGEDAGPLVGHGIGKSLLRESRNVREDFGTAPRRGGERLDPAGCDLSDHGRPVPEQAIELAAEEVGHGGRSTAVGHLQKPYPSCRLKKFEPKMGDRAEAGDRNGDPARVLPCQCREISGGTDGHPRIHHQHGRIERHQANADEILDGIVRRVGAQVRIYRSHPGRREVERVPVRFRLGYEFGPQRAICARPILHDHDLAERFAQIVGEEPRHEIRRSTGREADNEPNRTGRIALRLGDAGQRANARVRSKVMHSRCGFS